MSIYDDVVYFAQQRHIAWEGGMLSDEYVRTRKFTNVFRVLDRGSQYLLGLMDDVPITQIEDRLALSYLYRQVNRPDTMEDIIAANDDYLPTLTEVTDPDWIRDVVGPVVEARPGSFLSGAYMIYIKPGHSGGIIEKMLEAFPAARAGLLDVAEYSLLEHRVRQLQATPGIGPFLAMQIATDLGYCKGEKDQENDFVLAGPGSRKGVAAMMGQEGYASPGTALKAIREFPVHDLPALPYSNGRPASLMDIQNVFCEFSKYSRYKAKGQVGNSSYQRNPAFETRIPKHFVQVARKFKKRVAR